MPDRLRPLFDNVVIKELEPGDHVIVPRAAGVWVEVEDERLLVCRVREILGVIESQPAAGERLARARGPAVSRPMDTGLLTFT